MRTKKEERGADKERGECCAHRAATDHRLAQRHNTNTDRSLRLPDPWQPSWSRHLPLKEPTRLFSFFGRPEIGNRKQFKSTHNIAGPSHFHLVLKQGNYTIDKIWKGKEIVFYAQSTVTKSIFLLTPPPDVTKQHNTHQQTKEY